MPFHPSEPPPAEAEAVVDPPTPATPATTPHPATTALPAIARVLDSLAAPMERAQMAEPAAALRRGAGHARALGDAVTGTVAAGRSLLGAIAAILPPPGKSQTPPRRPAPKAGAR